MRPALFSISCTTCQASLNVRDESAIGSILPCPKCGSMVQVVPPEGWEPPVGLQRPEESSDSTPPGSGKQPDAEQAAVSTKHDAENADVSQDAEDTPPDGEGEHVSGAEDTGPEAETAAGIVPPATWASPTELLLRKLVTWAAIPVATLVILGSAWLIFSSREKDPTPEPEVAEAADPTPQVDPDTVVEPAEAPLLQLDRRWLPEGTKVVFSLRASRLAQQAQLESALEFADSAWGPALEQALRAFELELGAVRRISWASTDPSDWRSRAVIVIELEETLDNSGVIPISNEIDVRFGGLACRRFSQGGWPHPFLLPNRQTIVTGREELLRQLASRDAASLQGTLIEEFLGAAEPDADALFALDLVAARQAGWRMPTAWMDIWPAGSQAWRAVWETPLALGVTYRQDEPCSTELALICQSQSSREMVRDALEKLVASALESLDAGIGSLDGRVESGKLSAEQAERYETLLAGGSTALRAARFETVDQTVWMRIGLREDGLALASVALDSRLVIRVDWLDAARRADQAIQTQLLGGLSAYQNDKGHFPVGAGGGTLLPAETRLSWIASMLPYYEHEDWHRDLSFGHSWNSLRNNPVTQRPLHSVTNPALGSSRTEAGFPVTHYVGVAGVGAGAGNLARDDPRAGLFGFRGATRPEDIKDGAANTMAYLGVSGQLGPWAAGGHATVRGLTTAPYVNGPDGFGSGQPGGMSVGMADGSVRFVSKDIDPNVLEAMATIAGGEAPTAEPPDPVDPAADDPSGEGTDAHTPPDVPDHADPGDVPEPEEPLEEPIRVDVEAQLAAPVAQINFPDVALADAVALLSDLSAVPITFDLESMWRLGVRVTDPVNVKLVDTTIGQALEAVVSSRKLAYVVENNQILVTIPPDLLETLRSVRYAVPDLSDGDPAAMTRLAETVTKLVVPQSWREAGGRGTIRVEGDALLVEQTTAVQYDVLTFCEKLRRARGKPLKSRLAAERFDVSTRLSRASTNLKRPTTFNFNIPTPLGRIVSDLAEFSQTHILLDSISLGEVGKSAQTPAMLTVSQRPLGEALTALTEPLGLTYRILDADTFEITTPRQAAARLTLEFHAVGDLLGADAAAEHAGRTPIEELMETITSQLAPKTWSEAGGPGVLHYDEPSGSLIVLQSQPVHSLLEELLRRERVEMAPGS